MISGLASHRMGPAVELCILRAVVDFGIHQILDEMIDGAPITVDAHVTHSNLLSLLKTD